MEVEVCWWIGDSRAKKSNRRKGKRKDKEKRKEEDDDEWTVCEEGEIVEGGVLGRVRPELRGDSLVYNGEKIKKRNDRSSAITRGPSGARIRVVFILAERRLGAMSRRHSL